MMLDALSKATTTEPAVKGSARSGKGDDGEDAFSSTLTRISGRGEGKAQAGPAGDETAQDGASLQDGALDIPAEAQGLGRATRILLTNRQGLAQASSARISISQAGFGAGHSAPEKGLEATPASLQRVTAEEVGGRSDDSVDIEVASTDTHSASETNQNHGASELLNILAGPAQAWSASGAGQNANTVDGRKSEAAGRGGAKTEGLRPGADVSGETLEMPTTELESAVQPARSFRFSDPKGGDVAAELTRAANAQDRTAEKAGAAPSVENVTVVESRRFLGLAPSSNGASLLASMVGDTGWSSAMQSGAIGADTTVGTTTGSAVHMLKLQMNPHDLGSVTATLRLIGEELHVHLTVETRAAYRQLSEDSKGMLDALKAQGFSVDQVTINISPTADADPQKGQENAATGQQMAGSGERNGNAQNRDQRPGFDAEMNGKADGNDLGTDKTVPADPVGARSGQLYL